MSVKNALAKRRAAAGQNNKPAQPDPREFQTVTIPRLQLEELEKKAQAFDTMLARFRDDEEGDTLIINAHYLAEPAETLARIQIAEPDLSVVHATFTRVEDSDAEGDEKSIEPGGTE